MGHFVEEMLGGVSAVAFRVQFDEAVTEKGVVEEAIAEDVGMEELAGYVGFLVYA